MIVSIWRNLWCLSENKKSNPFFPFSLRYCKDIQNLLFWALWEYFIISHEKSYHQSVKNFHAYMHVRKINFITHFFLKILQRNSKLVIFGSLGMHGHAPKMIISVWRNLCCLSASKNNLQSSHFSWDIPKILQIYYFGYFGKP